MTLNLRTLPRETPPTILAHENPSNLFGTDVFQESDTIYVGGNLGASARQTQYQIAAM